MKLIVCAAFAVLLLTGCRDSEARLRIRTLEIQIKNLESEIRLLKAQDDFHTEMDASAGEIMEKLMNSIEQSQQVHKALRDDVNRHDQWIQAVEARAQPARPGR